MAVAPGETSSQSALLLNFADVQAAGTLVHIQSGAGDSILTFAPSKAYQSLAFSSPELTSGETYAVYLGGSATGDETAASTAMRATRPAPSTPASRPPAS